MLMGLNTCRARRKQLLVLAITSPQGVKRLKMGKSLLNDVTRRTDN